jgi:hypothetical protein
LDRGTIIPEHLKAAAFLRIGVHDAGDFALDVQDLLEGRDMFLLLLVFARDQVGIVIVLREVGDDYGSCVAGEERIVLGSGNHVFGGHVGRACGAGRNSDQQQTGGNSVHHGDGSLRTSS